MVCPFAFLREKGVKDFGCPFLVISDKKRTKRNAAQGGEVLQNSADGIDN
jgi:hypothetical protein